MSRKFDEKLIGAITDDLDMGMECYYHIPTGTFECHPDMDLGEAEPEDWQEVIDKIKADEDNYVELYGMGSREGFKIMEDFAEAQTDAEFKSLLIDRLTLRKPFRNFRDAVDESDYRDDWFAFKRKREMNWVKAQLEEELSSRSHLQDKMNSSGAGGIVVEDDSENILSHSEPDVAEDIYRKRLIEAYQNLLDFKNELFTNALNLAMAGELKEIDSAFEEGDTFTFTIEHLEDSKDINLQKLVEFLKQLDGLMGALSNINAIQEDELE